MPQSPLGRLEKVDVRQIWDDEAGAFTPWLAGEENIALLGETVGIELELEAQEKDVGPFRADILCKDTANGAWVLIENQLETTDHKHLGQLLTYAAGLHAVTIVWVAKRFTEEHRATLDWLNEITDDRFNFFGLEVELWKIGNSLVAPKFNVVCKPNDWGKTISDTAKTIAAGELSETNQLSLEYWTELWNLLDEKGSFLKGTKPRPQSWTRFSVGGSSFWLNARTNTFKRIVYIVLGCSGENAKVHFKLLAQDRTKIEKEIGETLEWDEAPQGKESHIELRTEADPTDRADWRRQHEWLRLKLEAFYKAFAPRVKGLRSGQLATEEDGPR